MSGVSELLREQIIKRMVADNSWWKGNQQLDYYVSMPPRAYLEEFYNYVCDQDIRRAVILMGPRRVGKTVMIFHTIAKLLANGVPPTKIIYLSIDTPIYNNMSLEELFLHARMALKQEEDTSGYYVFFDEIQYLKDWEVHLKSLVDTYHHVKFVGSGSAAAALKMKSIESGAGRFTDFMLPPLTFVEYLTFNKADSLIIPVKDHASIPIGTIDMDELNRLFVEYINYGGYPEVVFSEKIRRNPGQYIRNDIIDKVLLRDLPSLYGISDIQELNKLFVHIAFRSGNEFSYETLSKEAGIKKETIRKYLEYLEAAFLIKVVNRLDQNAKRMQRITAFKIYLTNPSLRCALFTPINESDDFMGNMVETALFSQCSQGGGNSNLYYANWTKGRERGEVDMVWVDPSVQKANAVTEIKWTNRYAENPTELKSLLSFLAENGEIHTVVVTSKTQFGMYELHSGQRITFVPSSLYAYWLVYDFNRKNNRM